MRLSLAIRLPLALAAATVLTACAETPVPATDVALGTVAEGNLDASLRTPTWAEGLRWNRPVTERVTVGRTIGAEGGRLELASTGLVLVVPAGAVSAPTRFEVAAIPGSLVAYEMLPHGTPFARPVVIEQRLRGTSLQGADASAVEAGSFADATQLDHSAGVAQVEELRPATLVAAGGALRFEAAHFSGWILTTARRR